MAKDIFEATLVWICGQFSAGRPHNPQNKNNITGDGAFEEDRGENCFWAVATPL
jgi:hypothetical protein